jgi:hypothetical protein
VLYRTLVSIFFKGAPIPVPVLRNVCGITCLLAGATVLSRIPRLDKIWPGGLIGVLVFVAGVFGYLFSVSRDAKDLLSSAFWISNGIIWFFLAASLMSAFLSKLKPRWGMAPLIGLGGVAAFLVLLKVLPMNSAALDKSLWALVLANAAFLYLWWLSALLFDLVYIWHRFICSNRTTAKILHTLRVRHKAAQEAEKKATSS